MRKLMMPLLILLFFVPAKAEREYRYYMPLAVSAVHRYGVIEYCMRDVDEGWMLNRNASLKRYLTVTPEIVAGDWSGYEGCAGDVYVDWLNVRMWDGDCRLPARERWDDYAAVINDFEPEPRFVEIWNEPDAVVGLYPHYGCVGDGALYGEFAAYLYERIDGPQVIVGGVSDIRGQFVRDMLETVGDSYDGLSFHCYEHYRHGLSNWCMGLYDYATTLTDKPVYLSETAVLFKEGTLAGYLDAQVEQFERLTGLLTLWHWHALTWNGWPEYHASSDLFSMEGPNPVWDVYKNAFYIPQ